MKKWYNAVIKTINDFIDNSTGKFLNHKVLCEWFAINCPFTQYFGLISAIPAIWKDKIRKIVETVTLEVNNNPKTLIEIVKFQYETRPSVI